MEQINVKQGPTKKEALPALARVGLRSTLTRTYGLGYTPDQTTWSRMPRVRSMRCCSILVDSFMGHVQCWELSYRHMFGF
jgi:hypothetical protein